MEHRLLSARSCGRFRTVLDTMKNLRSFLLLLMCAVLAGCANLTTHQRAVLQAHNVAPPVYNKMMLGEPLSLPDIIELAHRAVPPGLVIDYLDTTETVYRLQAADVARLRKAGVSDEVINYMLSTAREYGPALYGGGFYPYGQLWYPYDPYFYGGPEIFIGGGYYGRWHGHHGGDWHGHGGGGFHHHH